MNSVEVEIYGRKYKLKGENAQKLRLIAEKLNEKLIQLGENYEFTDFNKLLLLCSLQLQEQLLDLTQANQGLKDELERMNEMISTFIRESGNN
ncbi:MAG: cell division protein ZapA [Candidatus Cloacimonadaceae bacterium]|nr:cell division protein ZapA [Candidatus Cloacimonadota bacterium]HQL14510.1 cell division protein ZapA [Candidatus Cloacimonadota bacterium]